MATEKFFVFNEDGALKRLKGRIVRFLDNEDPSGSDKSAIRTSLEVSPDAAGLVQADIGTDPNEIPVNGMLGDMAFQDSAGVSVGQLEVTGKMSVLESGNVSIGAGDVANNGSLHVYRSSATADLNLQSAGGSGRSYALQSKADGKLVVRDNNAASDRLTIDTTGVGIGTSSPSATVEVTDATTNVAAVRVTRRSDLASTYAELGTTGGSGEVRSTDNLVLSADFDNNGGSSVIQFKVDGTERALITNSGNLVIANGNLGFDTSGKGIDFGSGAGGTGTPAANGGLLDDYERGTATPTDASGAGLTLAVVGCNYIKIGSQVTAWVQLTYPTTSDTSTARVGGFPFAFKASDIDRIGGFVVYQNTGLDVSVLGTNSSSEVTFRNNSGTAYTNAQLSEKIIWFCVTYDVS